MNKNNYLIVLFLLSIVFGCKKQEQSKLIIEVHVNDSLYSEPISGKLLVLFQKDTSKNPIWGPNPFHPQPFYRIDFKNWDTKKPFIIDNFKNWWDKPIDSLQGQYAMVIVIDFDTTKRDYLAKGNSYSEKQIIHFTDEYQKIITNVEKESPYWEFMESEIIKEELFESMHLSKFWSYPIQIRAGVVLPENYSTETKKDYSIVYVFPGFGSHHATVSTSKWQINRYGMNTTGEEKIFVFCNGEFNQGYHHFADSENNGPWGKAFTEEFIPYIENKYRTKKDSRYLMGQSSGAWTSIWLQVNYPDYFLGAFAGAPDPIDFRAMGNNIYKDNANFYISNKTDSVSIALEKFNLTWAKLELTIDEYSQFKTWESTFSNKNESGKHYELFNRSNGEINPIVAEQWKDYDIALIIKSNPDYYRNKLENKLHIFVSDDDDYGLDESIRLFNDLTDSLQIDVDIQFLDGLGHNVWTDELRGYIHKIIDAK